MIVIEEGRENLYDRSYMRYAEDEDNKISYKGAEVPLDYAKAMFECGSSRGIAGERMYELIVKAYEELPRLSPFGMKKLLKAEHNGKADIFLEEYQLNGNAAFGLTPNDTEELEKLNELFSNDRRFNGRIPQIAPMIAATMEYYKENGLRRTPEEIVEKFQLRPVKALMDSGIPKADAVNLFCFFDTEHIVRLTGKNELCEMISALIAKGAQKKDKGLLREAVWMAEHPDSNISLMREIYDERKDLDINPDMTVEAVQTRLSYKDSHSEVRKVEKAYKDCDFKLRNCKCLLRDNPATTGKYRGRILEGTDPLQVELGYLTECCQKLGDAGESAMMYGLTNDHAGFWVLENKNTGKIYAQAEAWEWDEDTLVLDNIEFANDAEIDQYKQAIGEYVLNSPYKNIIMGCGYNGLSREARGQLKVAPEVTPHVTPYDVYVLSYEDDADVQDGKDPDVVLEIKNVEKAKKLLDDGVVTYYDYLYSDVDDHKGTVYLKENGIVSPYFGIEQERNREAILQSLKNGSIIEQAALFMTEHKEYADKEEDGLMEEENEEDFGEDYE